jgi:hypothetical protein
VQWHLNIAEELLTRDTMDACCRTFAQSLAANGSCDSRPNEKITETIQIPMTSHPWHQIQLENSLRTTR